MGNCLEKLTKICHPVIIGIRTVPLCRPRNSAVFTVADSSTALAISNKDDIKVFQVFCFTNPKHQSGENLV